MLHTVSAAHPDVQRIRLNRSSSIEQLKVFIENAIALQQEPAFSRGGGETEVNVNNHPQLSTEGIPIFAEAEDESFSEERPRAPASASARLDKRPTVSGSLKKLSSRRRSLPASRGGPPQQTPSQVTRLKIDAERWARLGEEEGRI